MEELSPLSSLEKQAKVESIRGASCWHWGQEVDSLARLNGLSSSNCKPHSGQRYSYIGILVSFLFGRITQSSGYASAVASCMSRTATPTQSLSSSESFTAFPAYSVPWIVKNNVMSRYAVRVQKISISGFQISSTRPRMAAGKTA